MSKRYPGGVIRKTPATPTQSSASGVWNMTDVTQAQQTNNWPVANVPNPMSRSLRFRSSASAYLNRTPASAGNLQAWTWSGWIKLGIIDSGLHVLFQADTSSVDTLEFDNGTLNAVLGASNLNTTAVFRDPAAWYHIVWNYNGATQNVYVNNVLMVSGSKTGNTKINSAVVHYMGTSSGGRYFDGYMTEVNFIGGQALSPTAFGQYDQFSNWTSKKYTNTYGTNGFYLPFSNNSSTGTLGLDFSGNNNTWTTNNFSVTPSYQYTTYTSGSGTYTVPSNVTSINYLVVAGGGGGGNRAGGGGGAGGLIQGTMAVTPGQTFAYSVGAGGAGGAASSGTNNNGTNGSNSTFGSLTAVGGGAGATPGDGIAGGSGGGAGHGGGPGGAGTLGQGSTGGTGASAFNGAGGGGGAGAVGGDRSGNSGGAGGAGLTWINGTTYAGGGGGGGRADIGGSPGAGGSGGGGAAGSPGANGTANTGGGGGGGMYTGTGQAGGTGGSGVVIVAYATGNSTYDSMTDVPTQWTPYNVTGDVGGIIRGNYCVMNPLLKNTNLTASNGNLQASSTAADWNTIISTMGVSSGKYYWEVSPTSGNNYLFIGLTKTDDMTTFFTTGNYVGKTATSYGFYGLIATKYNNSSGVSYGSTTSNGDVVGVALDMDAGTLTFYKNGSSLGQAYSGLSGNYTPAISLYGTTTAVANFGQYAFTYAPPSGYKSLCTTNLPTPTIQQGNLVMDATLWTGNGSARSITNAAPFKPDFVWIKSRTDAGFNNDLFDSVRGVGNTLFTDTTGAEEYSAQRVTAFNSNGFSLGTAAGVNYSGSSFVGWQWQAGQGTNTTNTAGSITSTVSVNATAGFSIVLYTGSGANATVGHGLGVAPSMVIVKSRSIAGSSWATYTKSVGPTATLFLEQTSAPYTNSIYWNNTSPTSSVFSIGTTGNTNSNGDTYVAYCWSQIAGFSAFGSYTGNGSADGPFVYTGFRPKFVMLKRSDSTSAWTIQDSARDPENTVDKILYPNYSDAEFSGTDLMDFVSNGFKLRQAGTDRNASGGTYIYMAFAEYPFKSALGR